MQLLGPTVFLKSVSINIITLCSRHHWIFYCNVPQNITPTLNATQKKVVLSDRNFLFWLKGLCEVCFICGSFCVFLLCFLFWALGKVLGPFLIKWLRVFFFLSGIYYWHFPGIGLGTRHIDALRLNLQPSSPEKVCSSGLQAKQFAPTSSLHSTLIFLLSMKSRLVSWETKTKNFLSLISKSETYSLHREWNISCYHFL